MKKITGAMMMTMIKLNRVCLTKPKRLFMKVMARTKISK